QHVPELGEFVEAGTPQPTTERCEAGVVGEQRSVVRASFVHRAEFEHRERSLAMARPRLAERHWRAHRDADRRRDGEHHGRRDDEARARDEHVERALAPAHVPGAGARHAVALSTAAWASTLWTAVAMSSTSS